MVKKTLFLFSGFYFLVLFQSSFLVPFSFFGFLPNLILIVIVLVNAFSSQSRLGLVSAFVGGFYLDIFSLSPFGFFGFYTLVALVLAYLVQMVFQRHVRFSFNKRQ